MKIFSGGEGKLDKDLHFHNVISLIKINKFNATRFIPQQKNVQILFSGPYLIPVLITASAFKLFFKKFLYFYRKFKPILEVHVFCSFYLANMFS